VTDGRLVDERDIVRLSSRLKWLTWHRKYGHKFDKMTSVWYKWVVMMIQLVLHYV